MSTYLDRILAQHRERAGEDDRNLDQLVKAASAVPAGRGFRRALLDAKGLGVISEVKRRSPSKGDLAPGLDPATLAQAYRDGGASCLSVLTDEHWFGGSVADLTAARAAVDLPVLRKDFVVDSRDVADTRLMGADCVLLIAAALDDSELTDFYALARELTLDVLVEIHDEAELDRALAVDADLIGVNQRDLVTFEVDQARAVRMAPKMPANVVRVAESGIRGPDDGAILATAGYHAVLVGESLVANKEPTAAVQALVRSGLCS